MININLIRALLLLSMGCNMNLRKYLIEGKVANFIIDAGKELKVTDAKTGEVVMMLPRYAAWGPKNKGKNEVIDQDNNLPKLLKKYNLTKDDVHRMK